MWAQSSEPPLNCGEHVISDVIVKFSIGIIGHLRAPVFNTITVDRV